MKQRVNGKSSRICLDEKECLEALELLIFTSSQELLASLESDSDESSDSSSSCCSSDDMEEDELLCGLCMMVESLGDEIDEINSPRLSIPDPIAKVDITFRSPFTDERIFFLTGFTKPQIMKLFDVMHFPNYFTLNEGRHAHNVNAQLAFLFSLSRMRGLYNPLIVQQNEWGYDYSTLSKIFEACTKWIDDTHGHRLRAIPSFVCRFPSYNEAFKASIVGRGHEVPLEALNISCFIDATRIRVCRPSGESDVQRMVYNRRDKHNAAFQCVMGMDGIFIDMFGGLTGRHNDRLICAASEVNQILVNSQLGNPIQYETYSDKGYDPYSHIRCAHHGPGVVTPMMHQVNDILKPERVFEEIGFSKVKGRCPLLNETKHLMKLQLSPILPYFRVAVLLTNAHTCFEGNSTQLHFEIQPPSVEEYFS